MYTDHGTIQIAHIHINVETGAEVALFPEKECISRIFVAVWMRSSRVGRASYCQCQSRNSPGFDPSILRHNEIRGAADEAVSNNVHNRKNPKKIPLKKLCRGMGSRGVE
jgi:hypothetical protein